MSEKPTPNGNFPYYDGLSRKYAAYWSHHEPNQEQYKPVRTSLLDWYRRLVEESGIKTADGALIICGPGPHPVEPPQGRELSEEIVQSHVMHHPQVIVADFVPEFLHGSIDSITKACGSSQKSKRLLDKIIAVRRDLSHGLSVRFDALVTPKLECVTQPGELFEFMEWIKDIGVEDIMKQPLPEGREGIHGVDGESVLSLQAIEQEVASVRFVIANFLLAGWFAANEQQFRQVLLRLAEEEKREAKSGSRIQLHNDAIRELLEQWHRPIQEGNEEAAVRFIDDGITAHPDAHFFMASDVNTNYENYGQYVRLDEKEVLRRLKQRHPHIKMMTRKQYIFDDDADEPPHSHGVNVLEAYNNGEE
ncbi:hypothetical protein COU77_03425 [Candidatus Peregrinibacteria bacterium CG10_big_fil_rev_8_21_14_0_10_49_16]|nr:MAG: hypothetical protein COW95_02835 [Candidatus Peregrinibacteria bacterium CG22_combo_CG10-13_8_21_14_all_49_11]PIR51861.1 MAG: hypothetical protein COU77_03425 [Candidatus Peregrinibacteria bacterium CG10_big_fil_rev_8_21_14_0_10_49_16]